ncbi:MAG: acetolactate decarboxylase [candidate division WS1 bacterium]|nr:acetolactate decarboxylase [candidate division WS1 bacterium]
MRRNACVVMLLLLFATVAGAQNDVPADRDVLYQTSTIGALLQGVYLGDRSIGTLSTHGDFGLGTIAGLDGELVVLDGRFFTVQYDGAVRELPPDTGTPFAAVTWFDADRTLQLIETGSMAELQAAVEQAFPSRNLCYAVRVKGNFSYVKTRSVPRQEPPYRPLTEVVAEQSIFEFEDVAGTLVGFWLPAFTSGINVPGWHLHFITEDFSSGGHLLECRVREATAEIDLTDDIVLDLPLTEGFLSCPLEADDDAALHAVEMDPDGE